MNPEPHGPELTLPATTSLPHPNKFALITQSIPSCKRKKILKLFKVVATFMKPKACSHFFKREDTVVGMIIKKNMKNI